MCILNLSTTTFTPLKSRVLTFNVMRFFDVDDSHVAVRGENYALLRMGKLMYGNVSGTNIYTPECRYFLSGGFMTYSSTLPDGTIMWIQHGLDWVRTIGFDGSIISEYRAPMNREISLLDMGVDMADYVPTQPGYEIALFEMANKSFELLRIVSGSTVVKTLNVSFPSIYTIGIRIFPPLPGTNKSIIVLYNYSSDDLYYGVIDLESGDITFGSNNAQYSYGYPANLDGQYCYIITDYYSDILHIVDPNNGYIKGRKTLPISIYGLYVDDVDYDSYDEVVTWGSDGGNVYVYLMDNDLSIIQIGMTNSASPPVIYDIVPEDGKEIIFHYNNYLYIYNPVSRETILSFDVGIPVAKVLLNYPIIEIDGDRYIWLLASSGYMYLVRLLEEYAYESFSIDVYGDTQIYPYSSDISLTPPRQSRIGESIAFMMTTNTRYGIGRMSFSTDIEAPSVSYSSTDIIKVLGYSILIDDEFTLSISAEDDTMLQYVDLYVSYIDMYGNIISSSITHYTPGEKQMTRDVDISLPQYTRNFSLEIEACDAVGRVVRLSDSMLVDLYSPVLQPNIPNKTSVRGDETLRITTYVVDDTFIKSVYVEWEGRIIPMWVPEDTKPVPGKQYYYVADVYIEKFDGEKELKIVAIDIAGRKTEMRVTLTCKIPLTEQPVFQIGIGILAIVLIVIVIYMLTKRRRSENVE